MILAGFVTIAAALMWRASQTTGDGGDADTSYTSIRSADDPSVAVRATVGVTAWSPSVALDRARFSKSVLSMGEALLGEVSRSVRAGRTPAGALRQASWVGLLGEAGAQRLAESLDAGRSVQEVLGEASAQLALRGDTRCGPVIRAFDGVALADRLGGTSSDAIDRYLDALRLTIENRREAWVLSTQARLSAGVVCSLPLVAVLLVVVTDAESFGSMLSQPWGRIVIGIGLSAEAVGLFWMRRLIGATLVGDVDVAGAVLTSRKHLEER